MAPSPSPSTHPSRRLQGLLCVLIVIALFAGFTLISRLGLTRSVLGLPDLAALRFGVAGLLMLPWLLRAGFAGITLTQALLLAATGGLGFALTAYTGFLLAPASHGAALLHGTLPLTTCAMAYLLTGERPGAAQRLGLLLIGLGVIAMAWDSLRSASASQLLGDAALLAASLCWSAYVVMARRLQLAPAHAAALVAVLSCLAYLPVYALLPGKALFDASWMDIAGQALFQGVLLGAVSIFVYTRAVAALGAQETALYIAVVPGLTTLLAMVLLSEMPTPAAWAGVALMTLGMLAALPRRRARAPGDESLRR